VTGGAIGNLVDRLRSARGVVDFIDVGFPDGGWRFYIFNVADSAVSIGAVLLAIILFRRTEDAPVSTGDAAGPRALASPPAAASPSTDQPAAAD
jgi:signal peptidase II